MYVLISHTKKIDILLLFSYTQLATKKRHTKRGRYTHMHTLMHCDKFVYRNALTIIHTKCKNVSLMYSTRFSYCIYCVEHVA